MAWNVLGNITETGNGQTDLVNTLVSPATANSSAFPEFWMLVVLVPIFIIIATRTFFKERDKIGRGNIWGSLAVAGFMTTLVGLIMTLIGLISSTMLAWLTGVTIVFGVIFLIVKE